MKVFLLQAYLGRREAPIFPLGLAYIAASLSRHEVKAFDPNVAADPYHDLVMQIEEFDPEVIGISFRNIDTTQYGDPYYYFKTLKPTLELLRKLRPRVPLVIGGPAFSIFADQIMARHPEIDLGVYLDGEESFPELLEHLDSPERVKGVYYRQNGAIHFTGERPATDFIWSLKPRWDLFELSKYDGPESIGVLSRRGCSLKCIYCVYPFLTGTVQKLRPPAGVVDEIEELVHRWGVKQFVFADSVFALPKHHAAAICREIIRRGVKVNWGAFFNERLADREFLQLAKDAGCVSYDFSSDGFNDRSLQLLRKPFTFADVWRTYQLAQTFQGVQMKFFFFANPPGQTVASYLHLMWLFFKTKFSRQQPKPVQVFVNVPRLMPNTELYAIALAEGSIAPEADLLPDTETVPLSLFYHNPQAPFVDVTFDLLHRIKTGLKKLIPNLRFS